MDNCIVNCIPQLACDILMESHIKNDGQKYINAQQAFLAFIWWPVKILINYFCVFLPLPSRECICRSCISFIVSKSRVLVLGISYLSSVGLKYKAVVVIIKGIMIHVLIVSNAMFK